MQLFRRFRKSGRSASTAPPSTEAPLRRARSRDTGSLRTSSSSSSTYSESDEHGPMQLFVGTWNVNAKPPSDSDGLIEWLGSGRAAAAARRKLRTKATGGTRRMGSRRSSSVEALRRIGSKRLGGADGRVQSLRTSSAEACNPAMVRGRGTSSFDDSNGAEDDRPLDSERPPDVFVIGMQEVVSLKAKNVMSSDKINEREQQWGDHILMVLNMLYFTDDAEGTASRGAGGEAARPAGKREGQQYLLAAKKNLVGILCLVYVEGGGGCPVWEGRSARVCVCVCVCVSVCVPPGQMRQRERRGEGARESKR